MSATTVGTVREVRNPATGDITRDVERAMAFAAQMDTGP